MDEMNEVNNMPAGRPTKYDPAMCDIVIAAGEDGETLAGMAEACDVDRETINNWMAANPEFSRAVKRGLQRAQVWWERQGKIGTFGGVDGFNATSYIFQMKNRFRADWNDTLKSEHSGPDGGAIPIEIKRTIVDPKD
jgi:transposase